jgi:ABC-2 type transport system permease protein
MNRMLIVAWREFTSTVMTKGFLAGVVIFPMIMSFAILLVPRLISTKAPRVDGVVAVIDRSAGQASASGEASGPVATLLKDRLTPEKLAEDANAKLKAGLEAAQKAGVMPDAAKDAMAQSAPMIEGAAAAMSGEPPNIRVEVLPADTDVDAEKSRLRSDESGASDAEKKNQRLALIVVAPDAVTKPAEAEAWGSFEVFVRPKLDERWQRDFADETRKALIDARLNASGQDAQRIREIMDVPSVTPKVVTDQGERKGAGGAQFLLPVAFMMLLWVSAFTGGQYLLTTTIEEKSNRIMEVLLSAVSPLQLMVGKILGQMGVGLLILSIYAGLGIAGLSSFKMLDLIDWSNVAFLIIYFFIAFFLIASMMAAVGSAVSDIHEAQSLIGPVMMVLIIPMLLIMPISTNPNSTLALALSFIPPMSPFIMVMRIAASTEPLPFWQIALSILIGLASVAFAAWAASKIFRIGVLLYGKPPNFATLIKWIRMA